MDSEFCKENWEFIAKKGSGWKNTKRKHQGSLGFQIN